MPRFKDENDFPDRLLGAVERVSNEVARTRTEKRRSALVNELDRPSSRVEFDIPRETRSIAVPWPSDSDSPPDLAKLEDDDGIVSVARPTDERAEFVRPSNRWPSTLWGSSARVDPRPQSTWLPKFENPSMVIPCIERQVRREVLFATKRHRKGARRRRRRRSAWSSWC